MTKPVGYQHKLNDSIQCIDTWYIEDALSLIRFMQRRVALTGYKVTLSGEVLDEGFSNKCLELVIVPKSESPDVDELWHCLMSLVNVVTHRECNMLGYGTKLYATYQGKKIDVLVTRT